MNVASRKEADSLIAAVSVLDRAGREGVALRSISARLGLPLDRTEKLLNRHTDYFVQVGSSGSYTLNRFGKFRGASQLISGDIEKSYKATLSSMYTVGALAAAVLTSIIVAR
ncbi:MAG: hypothetical protein QNJ19_15735 [Woeseiaceae bacterium]|nr:hypothetical protein [Woeseiaceae bacterium]